MSNHNGKKIAFIINTDKDIWFREYCSYVNDLNVPVDYEIEIIPVRNAKSMANGYNSGMRMTDAKYKVYIHKDCFY